MKKNNDSRKSMESLQEQGEFVAFEARPSSFFLSLLLTQFSMTKLYPGRSRQEKQTFFPQSQLWAVVSSWEAQVIIFIFSQKDGEEA